VTWLLAVEVGDEVVGARGYVDFLHAFWVGVKVDVKRVLHCVKEGGEGGGVPVVVEVNDFDVRRVTGVH
jgi:hypothetical protein